LIMQNIKKWSNGEMERGNECMEYWRNGVVE
jgi:hypothetical protein